MTRLWRAIINLDRVQIRSLFAVSLLLGIVSLSFESWVLLWHAHSAAEAGASDPWFGLVVKRLRYVALLQGGFALVVGLVVFGADYFKLRSGDKEISAGNGAP